MTSTDLSTGAPGRLSAAERREQILAVATVEFGERGYNGTTTDQVAQAAGISQPYVVRMFGSKQKLFLEVLNRALETLFATFRAALADEKEGGTIQHRLGQSFIDLVASAGVHRTLLQAFVSGNDPVIGQAARDGFVGIYRLLRDEAGFAPEDVQEFLGYGMLLSVLLGIELPSVYGESADADELLEVTLGEKCGMVLDLAGPAALRRGGTV